MKELTKKILESGIVDEATAAMMERWGVLEEGASELAKKATLKDATREELIKFAEEVGEEVEKERKLKETMFDLNQLRWPVAICFGEHPGEPLTSGPIQALIDRMGRYYFRPQDMKSGWLVPGRFIVRNVEGAFSKRETILEVSELFIGDQVAAIQVSVE